DPGAAQLAPFLGVEDRLQVGAAPAHQHADVHTNSTRAGPSPATISPISKLVSPSQAARMAATSEAGATSTMPMPALKVRRSSARSTLRAILAKMGGSGQLDSSRRITSPSRRMRGGF